MLGYFRNRQRLGYMVGSFLLVLVIFAFIVFYIPDFIGQGSAAPSEVAWVEGRPISAKAYLESYRRLERMYRAQLGERYSPALMQQLGLRETALQSLISQIALTVEAERLGLKVSDEEIRQQILAIPSFQREGKFIGRQAYLSIVAATYGSASQFEADVRAQLLADKLRALVTDGILVTPAEVEEQYRKRNEKAKLEYVFFPRAEFEKGIEPHEAELAAHFEKNQERYRLPVQRKLRYLTFSPEQFLTTVKVTDREIERYYNQNLDFYETPEQVKASHILFKTADKDEAEVRRRAETVLAEIRGGADFAELAKKHSEDNSAQQGGDLGFFGRGDMVPQFEQVAFALAEGEVSDLVRSTYGFHIIKVIGRQAGILRPLEGVKEQIRGTLLDQKARERMEEAMRAADARLRKTKNLEGLAQQYNLKTEETVFFGRQDALPQLGSSPEVRRLAFELKVGDPSSAVNAGRGYVFFRVLEERPSRMPGFEEVKDKVRSDVVRERAMAATRVRASEVRERLASASNLAAAAKAAGVEPQTQDNFLRGGTLGGLGRSAAAEKAIFNLAPGTLSEPLPGDAGFVLVRVQERSGFTPEKFAAERESFTEQLLNERRTQFWGLYLQRLQTRLSIERNPEALGNLVG